MTGCWIIRKIMHKIYMGVCVCNPSSQLFINKCHHILHIWQIRSQFGKSTVFYTLEESRSQPTVCTSVSLLSSDDSSFYICQFFFYYGAIYHLWTSTLSKGSMIQKHKNIFNLLMQGMLLLLFDAIEIWLQYCTGALKTEP